MEVKDSIKTLAKKYKKEVIRIRRELHQHPELSFKEYETNKRIAKILKANKIAFESGYAKTGIVVTIQGNHPNKKTIALRADIDALPIQETNRVKYKSKNEGIMHACGHDVHTASLLGCILILDQVKDKFTGTIKCIFQPGEELLPGGASLLIKEGVLKNPNPQSIVGQHVHPPLKVGKVGFKPGMYMASADEIYVTVKGKGGHAALPEHVVDPILIASNLIVSLQQIVSRKAPPSIPTVLSFGKINSAGGATNIIPDEVKLEGTFRTFDEKWRKKAHKLMKKLAEQMAKSMGGVCDFNIKNGYPHLYNNPDLTVHLKQAAQQYLGKKNVVDLPARMTSEDFAFYSHIIPASFYRLGTGNPDKGINSPVHTSTFNIDEEALEIGSGLMAWLAISQLS